MLYIFLSLYDKQHPSIRTTEQKWLVIEAIRFKKSSIKNNYPKIKLYEKIDVNMSCEMYTTEEMFAHDTGGLASDDYHNQ